LREKTIKLLNIHWYRRIAIKKGNEKVWSPKIHTEKKQIYLYINIVIKI